MTKKVVLDASALLALLHQEKGQEQIEAVLPNAIMSSVNVSEVVTVLVEAGVPSIEAESLTMQLLHEIVPFDTTQAFIAASFRKQTKQYGLSLGDRACLALASSQRMKVFTADKIWGKLDLGLDIQVIR